MPQMTRAEKRELHAETKRCREGGRPCRFCATLHHPGPHRPTSFPPAVVERWEQIAIDWQRHGWGQTPDTLTTDDRVGHWRRAEPDLPDIPSWRDTVSAWQP